MWRYDFSRRFFVFLFLFYDPRRMFATKKTPRSYIGTIQEAKYNTVRRERNGYNERFTHPAEDRLGLGYRDT